jgi:hypothetical protein
MDCHEAEIIITGGAPDSPELKRHLASCPACAALAQDRGRLAERLEEARSESAGVATDGLEDLESAVMQQVARERGIITRLRQISSGRRIVMLLACVAAVVLAGGLRAARPDLSLYPPFRMVLELGALLGLVVLAAMAWLRPLHRPRLRRRFLLLLGAACLGLPWALAALPAAHANHPASLAGTGVDLLPRAAACLTYAVALAAPLLLAGGLLSRRPRSSPGQVLVLGAAAGLAGLAALHLHCPITASLHLLMGHAPVAMVVGTLAAAGRWIRAPG